MYVGVLKKKKKRMGYSNKVIQRFFNHYNFFSSGAQQSHRENREQELGRKKREGEDPNQIRVSKFNQINQIDFWLFH